MNIQIFGKAKCFETKKAERYFKERGIKYQLIDIIQKGMSRGEFNSVKQALGGYENLIDPNCKDKQLLGLVKYLREEDKEEKILAIALQNVCLYNVYGRRWRIILMHCNVQRIDIGDTHVKKIAGNLS